MDTASTSSDAAERRSLAAIVFTDVSGFTARMELEETVALRLLEQDFATMREMAKALSGTVLKSTGDGLLLYFTSAVHAVTWALQAQRHFAERARTKTEKEIFRHRVGVHVGDVIVRADDVMGDGVNFAARVQAEAPPGGICISQVVHEMVKNKMELHTVRLEPRKLKNISGTVQMYHVLLEAPVRMEQAASAAAARIPRAEAESPRRVGQRRKPVLWLLAVLVAVGAGSLALVRWNETLGRDLVEGQKARQALVALAKQEAGAQGAVRREAAAEGKRGQNAAGVTTDGERERDPAELLGVLERWIQIELARYSADRPLLVKRRADGPVWRVRMEGGRVVQTDGKMTLKNGWAELPPEEQGMIIVSLVRQAAAPPADVVRGALGFAAKHGLPDVTDALRQDARARSLLPR